MDSDILENHQLQNETPEMDNIILDEEQHNSSNINELVETIYPPNQEDEKELNADNNNSELSKKSTSTNDNKKEEKKNESKNLLSGNNIKTPDNNGNNEVSSHKKRIIIKKKLSLSLKNYFKKILKKKISRKNIKILFKNKGIIHKLLEIVKKYKNKKKNCGFLKDIFIRSIRKLLNNNIKCKNPKKLLESGNKNIIINNLNYFSDSLENLFFWINKNYDNRNGNNDEILNEEEASKIGDTSCNQWIYNRIDNEALYMTNEDTLYFHFPAFDILPNTNYTTL